MADPVAISLGLRSNPARNSQAGAARLVNCFAEEQGEDGKTSWVIYSTEGLRAFGSALAGGGIRAMLAVNDTLYVVAGRNVYAVTPSGTSTRIGGIPTDGAVYMERNRRVPAQIGIVSDGLYFVIDTLANTLTQINDPDLPSPISLSFLDGYGILPISNGRFMLTNIDDFTVIDASDEGTCEAYPDEIVRSAVLEREAVFFGTQSIEWHQNTGDEDFPFERVQAIELGCLAGGSVAKVDTETRKTLIWVAPDHTVRMMNGYSGQVISTNEIEKLIKELDEAGLAPTLRGTSWSHAGRFFYALSCASWTRVYDSSNGNWHDRLSYDSPRWRIGQCTQFMGKLIGGDFETGQLYEMRFDVFDENGEYLVMDVLTPPVHAFPYKLKFSALYIDMATGVGLNSTSDHSLDPKIMVSWSDDGGASFSAERVRSLGRLAQTGRQVEPIYRLGKCGHKGRIFRFRISAPVERVMMQASVEFTKLAA